MNKSKLMLAAIYFVNIFSLIGIIIFYGWLNSQLDKELSLSAKNIENTELQSKLIERIQSGKMRNEEYVEIFKAEFEYEKTSYESDKALIELNSSVRNVIASIIVLQLFFLTLYVMYRTKN